MKEGLEILYELQQKDDQLKEIELVIKDIPQQIKKLENERDARANMVEKAKTQLHTNADERKKLEHDIQAIKDKISKYREQMKKVTTNKEFQGFNNEIKFEEENINKVEEKIIEKMVEADSVLEVIRSTESEFKKIADEYNIKIRELNQHLEYNKQKLLEETQNKKLIKSRLSDKLIKVYDNLFAKKAGKVVAYVAVDFCGVCNVKLRPQILNELFTSNDVVVCENCGRLLYKKVAEEPPV